jgi:hypothetical protein
MLTYPTAPQWTLDVPPGPLVGQAEIAIAAQFQVRHVHISLGDQTLYDSDSTSPMLDLASTAPGEHVLLASLADEQGTLIERAVRVTGQERAGAVAP